MTLSRPRTTRRVLRGSVLGLGLLVAGGVTAPAALAVVENPDETEVPADGGQSPAPLVLSPAQQSPAQESPSARPATLAPALEGDFGSGKDFTVQVETWGPVPGDLDLSGAVFRATPTTTETEPQLDLADDPTSFTCTTDVSGRCTFHGPNVESFPFPGFPNLPRLLTADRVDAHVPTGTYTLTQVSSSPGLAAATGSQSFTVCDGDCDLPFGIEGDVANDSLFRQSLVTTVIDADTAAPLACVGYTLTGPDYPHDGSLDLPLPFTGTVPAGCVASTSATSSPSTTAPTTTAPTTTTAPQTTDTDDDPDTSTPTTTTATSTATTTAPGTIAFAPAAAVTPLVTFGTQTSDRTGTMIFPGWFLPGDGYLLTPTTTPEGYAPDVSDGFTITTTAQQAADEEPAAVARALVAGLAAGAPAAGTSGGTAAATTPAAAATTTAATTTGASAAQAALATTGTPVGTMVLVGTGLVALGGGALATGGIVRRRARRSA